MTARRSMPVYCMSATETYCGNCGNCTIENPYNPMNLGICRVRNETVNIRRRTACKDHTRNGATQP